MKLNTELFIKRAKIIHGDFFDYSKTKYINSKTKVCIICPIHGEFWVLPHSHLQGVKCKKCMIDKNKIKYEDFIERAIKLHGNKYDYSKAKEEFPFIKNIRSKITIICPIHGEFKQSIFGHLNGYGCNKCGCETTASKTSLTQEEAINRLIDIYGNKYDYSKVNFINTKKKIILICPIHGEVEVNAYLAFKGCGCPKCNKEASYKKMMITNEKWIERAKKIHNGRYDYSLTEYNGYYSKVKIICPIHGEFEQTAYDHLQGKGCPKCKLSKMEKEWMDYLEDNNINYVSQYTPNFLRNGRSQLSIDIYLADYNIGIECQGIQHFKYIKFFDRDKTNSLAKRDKIKKQSCENNNLKLFYFSNLTEYDSFLGETVYHTIGELMNVINNI